MAKRRKSFQSDLDWKGTRCDDAKTPMRPSQRGTTRSVDLPQIQSDGMEDTALHQVLRELAGEAAKNNVSAVHET